MDSYSGAACKESDDCRQIDRVAQKSHEIVGKHLHERADDECDERKCPWEILVEPRDTRGFEELYRHQD